MREDVWGVKRFTARALYMPERTDQVLLRHGVLEHQHGRDDHDDAFETVADGVRHGRYSLQDHV